MDDRQWSCLMTWKIVWSTIKSWWWAVLGGILAVAAFIALGTRNKPRLTKSDLLKGKDPKGVTQSLQQMAVIEAEKAQVDVLIEKAKADTKVEAKREELKRIENEPDPVARRKRLAQWAERNI